LIKNFDFIDYTEFSAIANLIAFSIDCHILTVFGYQAL